MKISSYYNSKTKRIFDLTLAVSIAVFLLPLFIACYIAFRVFSSSPALYKQKRIGKNKNYFIIYKIRTMKMGASKLQNKLEQLNEAPYPMFKITDDPRFTKIGKYLSEFGLDEIPQLYNIIRGEMSFIGPRPLPVHEAEKLDESWDFRYKVRPGIFSNWASSPDRYKSLDTWKQLEIDGLKNSTIFSDLRLIINSIVIIIIFKLIKKIVN